MRGSLACKLKPHFVPVPRPVLAARPPLFNPPIAPSVTRALAARYPRLPPQLDQSRRAVSSHSISNQHGMHESLVRDKMTHLLSDRGSSAQTCTYSTRDDSTRVLDSKVIALQRALRGRDPFCTGIYALPDHQRSLYYVHDDSDIARRVDLSKAGPDDLKALYRACKPAEFGHNGENVFDASYRKAGKMDLTSFATLFDPRTPGIYEQVSKALLTQSLATMDMELYKLNVYGEGDFFKVHKDTPRSLDMFGSLVVVLPTPHEGGELVLRHDQQEWKIDFSDQFAGAKAPSACFVAFHGDVEHEVLPVTSGYRVTLTYNLYHKPMDPNTLPIFTPFHVKLKQALVDLVNDTSTLPSGGYLGFGLNHEYVHTGCKLLDLLPGQLKGTDRALADVCDVLGLRYSFRFLYRGLMYDQFSFIATEKLDLSDNSVSTEVSDPMPEPYLMAAVREQGLGIDQVEGVDLIGIEWRFDMQLWNERILRGLPMWWGTHSYDREEGQLDFASTLRRIVRDPVTQVLEITTMKSSVDVESPVIMYYGNAPALEYLYGTACMVIEVDPASTRKVLSV